MTEFVGVADYIALGCSDAGAVGSALAPAICVSSMAAIPSSTDWVLEVDHHPDQLRKRARLHFLHHP